MAHKTRIILGARPAPRRKRSFCHWFVVWINGGSRFTRQRRANSIGNLSIWFASIASPQPLGETWHINTVLHEQPCYTQKWHAIGMRFQQLAGLLDNDSTFNLKVASLASFKVGPSSVFHSIRHYWAGIIPFTLYKNHNQRNLPNDACPS